jgi:NADH:ubiquinone oxidoreductase subunit E
MVNYDGTRILCKPQEISLQIQSALKKELEVKICSFASQFSSEFQFYEIITWLHRAQQKFGWSSPLISD